MVFGGGCGARLTDAILVRWKGFATTNRLLTAKRQYPGFRNNRGLPLRVTEISTMLREMLNHAGALWLGALTRFLAIEELREKRLNSKGCWREYCLIFKFHYLLSFTNENVNISFYRMVVDSWEGIMLCIFCYFSFVLIYP